MADILSLLDALNSENDGQRNQAEVALKDAARQNLEGLVSSLTSCLCNDTQESRKLQAAIQLRAQLSRMNSGGGSNEGGGSPKSPSTPKYTTLSPGGQSGLKAGLLHSFRHEPTKSVRRKVVDAIAEVAACAAGAGCGEWPELLHCIFEQAGSPVAATQASALDLLAQLVEYAGQASVAPHATQIGTMLHTLLSTPTVAPATRVAALECCGGLLEGLKGDKGIVGAFQSLHPAIIAALQAAFSNNSGGGGDDTLHTRALNALTNMTVAVPTFFRPSLEPVCSACVAILGAGKGTLSNDARQSALEFLVTLAEMAGGTVRKVPALSSTVMGLALGLVADIPEASPGWEGRDDSDAYGEEGEAEDEEEMSLHYAGLEGLARLCAAVGAKQALPLFHTAATPLFTHPDWRHRAAALLGLSAMAQACNRELGERAGEFVATLLPFLAGDASQRVRHAAARGLGDLIVAFSSEDELKAAADASHSDLATSILLGKGGGEGGAGGAGRARTAAERRAGVVSIQTSSAHLLLPALTGAARVGGGNCLHTRSAAFNALSCLLAGDGDTAMDEAVLAPAAGAILEAASEGLATFPPTFYTARGAILTILGSLALDLGEGFRGYYPGIYTALKGMLGAMGAGLGSATAAGSGGGTSVAKEAELRGDALFALAACMEAVGLEAAGAHAVEYAREVMGLLQGGFQVEDGHSFEKCCHVMVKLAGLLEDNFSLFLPAFVPFLVEKMNQPAKASDVRSLGGASASSSASAGSAGSPVAGGGSGESSGGDGRTSTYALNLPGQGVVEISIDHVALLEKTTAMDTLKQLVMVAGTKVKGLQALVQPLLNVILPFALGQPVGGEDTYGIDMRATAIQTLPEILKAAMADRVGEGGRAGTRVLGVVVDTLTRVLVEGCGAKGGGGGGGGAGGVGDLLEIVVDTLDTVTYLGYASGQPEYVGPEDAPEVQPGSGEPGYAPAILPPPTVGPLFAALATYLPLLEARRDEIIATQLENPDKDDVDADNFAQQLEGENDNLSRVIDSVGYCVKIHKNDVLGPLFTDLPGTTTASSMSLGRLLLSYIERGDVGKIPMRGAALCLADDLTEHAPASHSQVLPTFFPHMLQCTAHDNALLRHPACYGVGVVAQHANAFFLPHAPATIVALSKVIRAPDAREEENEGATDNAVAALIKIALFSPPGALAGNLDPQSIMAGCIEYLPLKSDRIESRLMSSWLVEGLRTLNPMWMGPGGSRGAQLLGALAKTIALDDEAREEEEEDDSEHVMSDATRAGVRVAWVQLQATPAAPAVAGALASLSSKQRALLVGAGFGQ